MVFSYLRIKKRNIKKSSKYSKFAIICIICNIDTGFYKTSERKVGMLINVLVTSSSLVPIFKIINRWQNC